MALGKWIGGILGWIASGGSVLGALAGYAIGAIIDGMTGSVNMSENSDQAYGGSSQNYNEGDRNSFLFSMLVLASYIVKADGKIMHSEMEFIRRFLRQNFGEIAVIQGEEILLKLFEEEKRQGWQSYQETIRKACIEMRFHMNYSMRLQLLHFLVLIALADGHLAHEEKKALSEVARLMGLSEADLESLLAMGFVNQQSSYGNQQRQYDNSGYQGGYSRSTENNAAKLANAYKILGIEPTATDDEVKKAYRKMALKHHPDRVATLGEDVKKAAERKFQEINDAKERIYQARGI